MFDEKIVKKAIKGNDKAFIILMNQCKEQIYRTAFAYVKEEEMALDIVQEVVCKAYKSVENLREPKFFNTWRRIRPCKNGSFKSLLYDTRRIFKR